MKKEILEHIENDYFVKIEKIKQFPALKATFPDNIIYDKESERCWKIYEIDKSYLTIYKNGRVLDRILLPTFTHRTIILCDLLVTCQSYQMSKDLVLVYQDGFPSMEPFNLEKLLPFPNTPKENEAVELLQMIINHKDTKEFAEQKNLKQTEKQLRNILEVGGL